MQRAIFNIEKGKITASAQLCNSHWGVLVGWGAVNNNNNMQISAAKQSTEVPTGESSSVGEAEDGKEGGGGHRLQENPLHR